MSARGTRTSHIEVGDVLGELATMLLFQADQLSATASPALADSFIGFALGQDGRAFRDLPASSVDLARFPISHVFSDAVAFVARPRPDHVMGDEVHRLRTFMFHAPRSGRHSAVSRKQQRFMRLYGLCRTVTDAAIARWKLEVDRQGHFSLRELALLADVTDKTALISLARWCAEKRSGTSFGSYSILPIGEALSWLSAQRGFRSSWTLSGDESRVCDKLAVVKSATDLRSFIRNHRDSSGSLLVRATGSVPSAELAAWERSGFPYEPTRAAAFAQTLGLDVPLFVGKVLEVSLREAETRL